MDWLKQQDAHELAARMNGGARPSHRFLTRGFETEPYLFEPPNPQFYPELFTQNGFASSHRWCRYELRRDEIAARLAQLERVLAVDLGTGVDRVGARAGMANHRVR